jgi:hypothetical protein
LASRFSICFHMLFEDRPLTNWKNMKKLLHFFNVKNFPKTHWLKTQYGWKMASCMHKLVVSKTKTMVEDARLIFISCDEVTTCDQ